MFKSQIFYNSIHFLPELRKKGKTNPWCSMTRPKHKRIPFGFDCVEKVLKESRSQSEHFTGIHDRFLRDPVHRESQFVIRWSEQECNRRRCKPRDRRIRRLGSFAQKERCFLVQFTSSNSAIFEFWFWLV